MATFQSYDQPMSSDEETALHTPVLPRRRRAQPVQKRQQLGDYYAEAEKGVAKGRLPL